MSFKASRTRPAVRSPNPDREKPELVTLAVAFFDRHTFKKEVDTLLRSVIWWVLRWIFPTKPWHVIVIMDSLVYETDFRDGSVRYSVKGLSRYPFRVYHVHQEAGVADLTPWVDELRVTPVRTVMAVLGFSGAPGTVTCATTMCSLLGIEPVLETPWELMDYLEANCRE